MLKIQKGGIKIKHKSKVFGIFATLICVMIFLGSNQGVFADSQIYTGKGNIKGYLNLKDKIDESELMTYDEILEKMIEDGIPREEAIKCLNSSETLNDAKTNSIIAPNDISYTTRSVQVKVTSTYYVTINFYITVDSAYGAYYIKEVNNVSLNRDYNGKVKLFAGEIYYKQENRITVYYLINGDFYDKGSLSVSGGGAVGIGESAKLNFSVSYSSDYYAYIYKPDRIFYGNVEP